MPGHPTPYASPHSCSVVPALLVHLRSCRTRFDATNERKPTPEQTSFPASAAPPPLRT